MASRWSTVVVDALDPVRLGYWWARVLDFRVRSETPQEVVIGGAGPDGPELSFVAVPDAKAGKNRLHLDLAPDDQDAEVERLLDMGARHVNVGRLGGTPCLVLADPEGNEFCVLGPPEALGAG